MKDDRASLFLDQNHWIALSRAFYKKPDHPEHLNVLDKLFALVNSDRLIVPLQISHLRELSHCGNEDARKRLSGFFEELSKNWFFTAWSSLIPYEIGLAVAEVFNISNRPERPEVFGRGVFFSLSKTARETFEEQYSGQFGWNFFARLAEMPGALVDLLTFPNPIGRNRSNQNDHNRSSAYASAREASRKEKDSEQLQRRVEAAQYTIMFQDQLRLALAEAGLSFQDFANLGPEGASNFFDHVPSLNVDRILSVKRDRHWDREIEGNDLNDIVYLNLALPYCDIAVVEKFWGHQIRSSKLDVRYKTTVLTNLSDLLSSLEELK